MIKKSFSVKLPILRIFSVLLICCVSVSLFGCTPDDGPDVSSGDEPGNDNVFTYYYAETINDDSVVIPLAAPDQCLYNYDILREQDEDLTWIYNEIVYAATHLTNPNAEFANVTEVFFPQDVTAEQLDEVYKYVYFDHPELWHLRQPDKLGCALHPDNSKMAYLTYSDDIADIPTIDADIAKAADDLIAGTDKLTDVVDKIAYLSGYMYDNFHIDWGTYNESQHSTVKEMLLESYGVCVGYASTMTYLLQRMGISAIMGHGKVSTGMSHSWVITEYGGVYRYTDNYYMKDKCGGTEHSLAEFFYFDDMDVYYKEYVTIDEGVLLAGTPVGAGITAEAPEVDETESDETENDVSSSEEDVTSETE